MATALKITYNDGSAQSFSFEHRNIQEIEIDEVEKVDLQILQNGKPIIYQVSDSWSLISVTFRFDSNLSVWGNIQTLQDIEKIMQLTMYYRNGTQAEQFNVKIDPNIDFSYHGGDRLTKGMKVMFYETKEYKTAMEYDIFARSV